MQVLKHLTKKIRNFSYTSDKIWPIELKVTYKVTFMLKPNQNGLDFMFNI